MTNPYEAPTADEEADVPRRRSRDVLDDETPNELIVPLRDTRPWVKLVGVAMLVGSFLIVLFGVLMAALSSDPRVPSVVWLVYAVFGAIYFAPSLHLLKYAASIQRLMRNRDLGTLSEALGHQKRFWHFVGVVTLLVIVLYALAIAVAVFLAFAGSGKHH